MFNNIHLSFLQGMLQLGPPKCTFGSGRDSEPRICAPVMLGK